jgi:hypothetical protein
MMLFRAEQTDLREDEQYGHEKGSDDLPRGVDAYIAVRATGQDDASLGRLPMTTAREARWEMYQKVSTPRGRAIYARRKVIAEPVLGQIKQAMGFRRLSLRGLAKVSAEWAIVCPCHNILKLRRHLGLLRLSAVTA